MSTKIDGHNDRALHDAMQDMARGNIDQIKKAARSYRSLLGAETVNAVVDGLTPLARLLHDMGLAEALTMTAGMAKRDRTMTENARMDARMKAMGALLDAGANPFLGTTDIFSQPRLALGAQLLMALADREDEGIHLWRGPEGQTPLHACVGRSDLGLTYFRITGGKGLASHQWVWARDDAGRTPLHTLWQDLACKTSWNIDIDHAKNMTQLLLDREQWGDGSWRQADSMRDDKGTVIERLALVDDDGRSIAFWMLQPQVVRVMEREDARSAAIWMEAARQAQALGELEWNTANAKRTGRAPGRL